MSIDLILVVYNLIIVNNVSFQHLLLVVYGFLMLPQSHNFSALWEFQLLNMHLMKMY